MSADGSKSLPSRDSIRLLPKVELHAHLFGCIRQSTIRRRLAEERGNKDGKRSSQNIETSDVPPPDEGNHENNDWDDLDLSKAFEYFTWVYQVVNDEQIIWEATKEVLSDFAHDGVVYLELRTTLKTLPACGMTHDRYMQILRRAVEWAKDKLSMTVRLILSLNRQTFTSVEQVEEKVAEVLRNADENQDIVVGIDIAGNPNKGDLTHALRLLKSKVMDPENPRSNRLKLTVHTAEVNNATKETDAILELAPHRLGHGCYLTPEQRKLVCHRQMPIEMCPSSNTATMGLKSMEDHHFGEFWNNGHGEQLCICTDDTGMLQTTLTDELFRVSQAFGLPLEELIRLQHQALKFSFAPEKIKLEIEAKLSRI